MNLEMMNKKQLQDLLASNQHTLRSIEIGNQNWRNAMLQTEVETGKMTLLEFNEKWDEAQKHNQQRVQDIEEEIYEIRQRIQNM